MEIKQYTMSTKKMHYFKKRWCIFFGVCLNKKEKYFFEIGGGEAGWKK